MSTADAANRTAAKVDVLTGSVKPAQLLSRFTGIDNTDVTELDFIDEEFARYYRLSGTEIQAKHDSVPDRVPTPDSLRRKLDTLYLRPEDVQRLGLPEGYPILSDAERTKLKVLEITDDFKRRLQALDATISERRSALVSCPVPDARRATALQALASGLYGRYHGMLYDQEDLQESVMHGREALSLCPAKDPSRPVILSHLSKCLLSQCALDPNETDFNEAIELGERSLGLTSMTPLRCVASQVARIYACRHASSGLRQAGDIDRAFQLSSMALEVAPAGDTARYMALISLSVCHHIRYSDTLDIQDLNRAISLAENALDVGPRCENGRWQSYHRLGDCLMTRFVRSNEPHELEKANALFRQTLLSCPFQSRERLMSSLCLFGRYSMFLQHDDFELTTAHCLHALQLGSLPTYARRSFLIQLGEAFSAIYEGYQALADLNRAIEYYRCSLGFPTPDAGRRIVMLATLCISISDRFTAIGNVEDYEEASALQQQILALQPLHMISHLAVLDSLAQAAAARHRLSHSSNAFHQVVHWCQRASSMTVTDEVNKWIPSIILAAAYLTQFQYSGNREYLLEARRLYYGVADTSCKSIPQVFKIIIYWIKEINCVKLPDEAFIAYKEAIRLLPRIVYLGYDQRSRLQVLAGVSTLSCDSAACALTLGRILESVEYLEAGRAVFWSQVLRSRTPLDGLPTDLSSRLLEISRQLETEHLSSQDTTSDSVHGGGTGNGLFSRQRLSEEFDTLVAQARLLPGFENFLKPKSFASLVQVAKRGPVVVLVASAVYGCGAVIFKPHTANPEHIALSDVTVETLRHHSVALSRANREAREAQRHLKPKRPDEGPLSTEGYNKILATLWKSTVKPVIEALGLKKSSDGSRPRIWWCPTGPFVFLPIHAAGIYGDPTDCTSDYMISSYTPTLDALILSQQSVPTVNNVLLVAEPFAPKQNALPQTALEIDLVAKLVPSGVPCVFKGNVTSHTETNVATVDWTADALPDFPVVHLACHGHQDRRDPLQSGFYLRDGNLTLKRLMKLKLPNAFFAFLSACESASGDRERPDETIHLAAAMLFAGFRSVVATMWTMDDADGPRVAYEVYTELFKTYPVIDPDAIPRALDTAVRKLRAKEIVLSCLDSDTLIVDGHSR